MNPGTKPSPQDEPSSTPPNADQRPTSKIVQARNTVVVVVLSLVLLEIILRFLGLANPILYDSDSNVGYRIKPNQHVSYFHNPITINAHGVRDSRPFDARDPNKKRVLCLGDSVTWGGIYERQENLFTSVAEHRLGNVEIVNAGVNGYSVHQMARLYENFLAPLDPDLIVACVLVRDFARPAITELTGNGVAFPTKKPHLAIIEALHICQLTAYDRWGWEWLEPPTAAAPRAISDEIYESTNVNSIVSLAKEVESKRKLVVAFLPIETGIRTQLRGEFARNLRRNGVKTVDLTMSIRLNGNDYVDGVHLSTSGHSKVGEALATVIKRELE